MAATPEARCKKQIKAILKEFGVYVVMPMGSGYGKSGVPDFVCCLNGRFFAIEAKADTKVIQLQQDNLDAIVAAGGRSFVVRLTSDKKAYGFSSLTAYLNKISKETV